MDITPNKLRCIECRAVVDPASGVVCSRCLATAHVQCWTSKCPSFECTSYDKRPMEEYLGGRADPPGTDVETLARTLVSRRGDLVAAYARGNRAMLRLSLGFFVMVGLFGAWVGVTNVAGPLPKLMGYEVPVIFLAVMAVTTIYIFLLWFLNSSWSNQGVQALARIAFIDARLDALGRWPDGSAKPVPPAKKAA